MRKKKMRLEDSRGTPTPLLPSREEICPVPRDLDGEYAVKHFLGKTIEEAEAMFRESWLGRQEDLMWMGPIAFRFYLPAAICCARRELGIDHMREFAHLASILEFRLEFEPAEMLPISGLIEDLCGFVREHSEQVNLQEEYGEKLSERYESIFRKLGLLKATAAGEKI